MKINSLLQTLTSKSANMQTQKEKSVGESLLNDYKSQLPKEVSSITHKYQVNLSTEDEKQITSFFDHAKGTDAQKLETLDIALYKGIEPTEENLNTLHQAVIHDEKVLKSLGEVPADEAAELTGDDAMKVIEATKLDPKIKAALKRAILGGANLRDAVIEVGKVVKAIQTGQTASLDQKSVAVLLKMIQDYVAEHPEAIEAVSNFLADKFKDFDVNAAASQIQNNNEKSTQASAWNTGKVGEESKTKLNTTNDRNKINDLSDSDPISDVKSNTQAQGKSEVNANDVETLTDAKTSREMSKSEASQNNEMDEIQASEASDEWLDQMEKIADALLESADETIHTLMQTLDIKTYLVETTTEMTIRVKKDFESFRSESLHLLKELQEAQNQVKTDTATIDPATKATMNNNLSKIIEKLNTLLMKSEIGLYTDMFTEKKLLMMSSELEKAQELLRQGQLSKTQDIVKSAVKLLEEIQFNPAQKRIQAFAQNKLNQLENNLLVTEKSSVRLETYVKQQVEVTRDQQGNRMARDILETMRFLGLNHEMEVAEFVEKNDTEKHKDWNQGNVKEILLKLMKDEIKDRAVASTTEQNLMNFSGQQMMNDSNKKEQPFYFFNLPIIDGESLGNMKVYMKGATKNHQMDWQNAELYFGVQLKQVGDIGLKVKIQQGNVDVQMMGNGASAIRPYIETVIQELSEIGYSAGDITYKNEIDESPIALKPQLETQVDVKNKASIVYDQKKGFDFKI